MPGYAPWESRHSANVSGDQVAAYEHWVDTVLRPKLESHRRRIATVTEEMGQYAELKEKLSSIMAREDQGPLEMLAELGGDCYTRVKIDDPSRVFVHVALGFHVEFTLPEAITFVGVKRSSLATTIAKLKEQESELAKDVVSAEAMVQELRELSTCAPR